MTKSDRHKKLRRRDKAKTQMTGVKKLGRSQNVIVPTFRAKKILIREQLQSPNAGDSVQVSRNKSLTDILHSLNHHNTNIKKEAILGLQEIILLQPEALFANLDKILEKVGHLVSSEEGSIRKGNLQLAEAVFVKISEEQVKPFWNLLISYVQCSLTHLNSAIRQSSIEFIMQLLGFFPNLVSSSFHLLLPTTLNLISSGTGRATGFTSRPDLKLDVSSKQSSFILRKKVLQFLGSCIEFHISLERTKEEAQANYIDTVSVAFEDLSNFKGLSYTYGYQETRIRAQGYDPLTLQGTTGIDYLQSNGTSRDFNSSTSRDLDFWSGFVQSCIPVLYQIWLEVRPESDSYEQTKTYVQWMSDRGLTIWKGPLPILRLKIVIVEILGLIDRHDEPKNKKTSRK